MTELCANIAICCESGKINLPAIKEAPEDLQKLLSNKHIFKNSRLYNSVLSITSLGTDNKPEIGASFKIFGKMCHRIEPLIPNENENENQNLLKYIFMTQKTKHKIDLIKGVTYKNKL